MKKIIDFPSPQDAAIPAARTEEFYKAARELSDFIKELPLSQPDNDKLINLIIQQVQAAEQGTFQQGFQMGIEFKSWQEEQQTK